MGMEALTRAAEAAGFAMASIEDEDYATPVTPKGEAVARGARTPKAGTALVTQRQVTATEKTVATSIVEQSVAAGNAIRQAVYGYIGSRGAPA